MAWVQPKTDWTSRSYFNYTDYNRIIGNIAHLKEMADELFFPSIKIIDMGSEKVVKDMIYAREINAIGQNTWNLNRYTYNFNTFKSFGYYVDNGPTPTYVMFNKIEQTHLLLYEKMQEHKQNLTRLAFTLGNQKGLKV